MKRNFEKLENGPFDLLVIGGGITGAWTAYDAARRGLKVALVEKNDWASGTSMSSSKMIHGGLRYLENYEFGLVRHSLKERKKLAKLAPHAVQAVRFCVPVYKGDSANRTLLKAGFTLYDLLAGRKSPVKGHQRFSRKSFIKNFPHIRSENLLGGFTYGDGQEDDARFTLEVVDGACEWGVAAVNHATASQLLFAGEQVTGAVIQDNLSGKQITVKADVVVNAAGPWAELLMGDKPRSHSRLVKGSHLVMPALPVGEGMLITSPVDGRVIFLIPWLGHTILGTTDSDYSGHPDDLEVTDEEVGYLLGLANRALGEDYWQASDICGKYAGVRTLAHEEGKSASKVSREWELTEPKTNLFTPVGGKYTTARDDASSIVDHVANLLNKGLKASTTGTRPFPWAPLCGGKEGYPAWAQQRIANAMALGVDKEVADLIPQRHGCFTESLLDVVRQRPELAKRIHPRAPFCWAELLYSVRKEMAQTLDDLLRRRVPLMLLVPQDEMPLEELEAFARHEFGWSETDLVDRFTLHFQ
jgi:glycerol-3-phosphate dehydrogenase